MRYEDIEPMMRGQWDQFFSAELGIEVPDRAKKNMPCPVCGGDDRAHFRDGEGRLFLFCRAGCGEGGKESTSPEELSMKLGGFDFPELVNKLADFVGYIDHNQAPTKRQSVFAPIYNPHKSPQQYAQEAPRNPAESALAETEIKSWANIPVTARNAVSGEAGDFLTINGNLAVPMYFYNPTKKDARPRLTGVIEVNADEKTITHGFSRGSFAIVGAPSDNKVFCTCYISALLVNKITGYQCLFSPSPTSLKKALETFGVNHVFVKTPITNIETIDLALLAYYDWAIYLLPDIDLGQTRRLITKSYHELLDLVLEDENKGRVNDKH